VSHSKLKLPYFETVYASHSQINCLAILPGDLSFITIYISDCRQFSDIQISQGSVTTYLRGTWYLNPSLLQINHWVCQRKNFENWEVMDKSAASCFFWPTVTVYISQLTSWLITTLVLRCIMWKTRGVVWDLLEGFYHKLAQLSSTTWLATKLAPLYGLPCTIASRGWTRVYDGKCGSYRLIIDTEHERTSLLPSATSVCAIANDKQERRRITTWLAPTDSQLDDEGWMTRSKLVIVDETGETIHGIDRQRLLYPKSHRLPMSGGVNNERQSKACNVRSAVANWPAPLYRTVDTAWRLHVINCSGRASELGGIVNLVDRSTTVQLIAL